MNVDYEHLNHASQMDPITFDKLMKEFGQDVWNYAFFLTRDAYLADDIAQEVFLQVYGSYRNFRGESSVKTWLLKITRNKSINYRLSALYRKVTVLARVDSYAIAPSAEDTAIEQILTDDIWRVILSLPTKFRELLVLEISHDLSIQEMAVLTGVAVGTVKSRLYRARRKVSLKLKEAQMYEEA